MANTLEIRFAKKLREKIVKDLNEAHEDLGSGTQISREDAAATGMNCAKYIGKIDGLKLALERLKQADEEIMGRQPDED